MADNASGFKRKRSLLILPFRSVFLRQAQDPERRRGATLNKPTLEERCAPNGLISESKIYKLLFVFCLLWFIFLCFFHYCSGRPLWLDENFLLQNIKSLQYKEIFGPLKNAQAFPRLYLVSIKFFAERFHYHVLALRFFPLVAMLFAFFIWAKIYKKGFLCKWSYLLSLFSFATSYSLSYYAAEFKHYSMDLLVVALFTLYLIYQKEYFDKKQKEQKIKLFFRQ